METSVATSPITLSTVKRYIARYNAHIKWEDIEPTTVIYYDTWSQYGGPEEGGWYYEAGTPIKTICVFSKKQAIREALKLHALGIEQHETEIDYLGWSNFRVEFDNKYGEAYPAERPHYC